MATPLPHISPQVEQALQTNGIHSLEDLANFPRTRLAEIEELSVSALEVLEDAMKQNGLEYGKD